MLAGAAASMRFSVGYWLACIMMGLRSSQSYMEELSEGD